MAKQWLHFSQANNASRATMRWNGELYSFCVLTYRVYRVKGQSVTIRPDGKVKIQKPKEMPLPTNCLDSTALSLESGPLSQEDQHYEYDASLALQLGDSLGSEHELFLKGNHPPRRLR